MKISKKLFGKLNSGEGIDEYTLDNGIVSVSILNYGGIITSLNIPDRLGKLVDIVLGFDKLEKYADNSPYFGCIIGRCAGRINAGKFDLNGKAYMLAKNGDKGTIHLHGGIKGFDKYVWAAAEISAPDFIGISLSRLSPDGEEGYPGNLRVTVTYKLTNNNEFILDYCAATDKNTPVALTNHTYFNLNGESSGKDILDTVLTVNADRYLPLGDNSVPTGKLEDVTDTPMDFREPAEVGKRIGEDFAQIRKAGGYDHPWILNKNASSFPDIVAFNPRNGIKMEIQTDQPCVVIYTSNKLDNSVKGKKNFTYRQHYGICFEAQGFPDAVNHSNFPSAIVTPGNFYKQTTIWKFSNR